MRTRLLALGLLAVLGLLWATWPGAGRAWVSVAALVPLAWLAWRGPRAHALVAFGAAALSTALLPAGAFDWRAWATALLLAGLAATLLAPEGIAPRAPQRSLMAAGGGLALLLVLLRTWTPTREALSGDGGVTAASALLLAASLVLVIVLTSEDEKPAQPEDA